MVEIRGAGAHRLQNFGLIEVFLRALHDAFLAVGHDVGIGLLYFLESHLLVIIRQPLQVQFVHLHLVQRALGGHQSLLYFLLGGDLWGINFVLQALFGDGKERLKELCVDV